MTLRFYALHLFFLIVAFAPIKIFPGVSTMTSPFYQLEANDIVGDKISFETFKDKVVLIVNTASFCGFTKQFTELQELYKKYKEQGLVILAFPCNQFGDQDPHSNGEIKTFCESNFNITFPLMEKIDVNGDKTHEVFTYLKEELPGLLGSKKIKWNFTKFLIDKKGKPIKRFAPQDSPRSIEDDIKNLLAL